MPFVILFSLGLTALACAVPMPVRAGALKDIEDSASRPPPADVERGEPAESSQGRDAGEQVEHRADAGGWRFLGFILLMPWSVPRLIVDQPCALGFAAYPYADGRGSVRHDSRVRD